MLNVLSTWPESDVSAYFMQFIGCFPLNLIHLVWDNLIYFWRPQGKKEEGKKEKKAQQIWCICLTGISLGDFLITYMWVIQTTILLLLAKCACNRNIWDAVESECHLHPICSFKINLVVIHISKLFVFCVGAVVVYSFTVMLIINCSETAQHQTWSIIKPMAARRKVQWP